MNLERFVLAQESDYELALSEIKSGRKRSHWMWYIFPQIQGLGYSSMAQFYAIKDKEEAIAYLKHPILGKRLEEITEALLFLEENDIDRIMGYPDNIKLKSSMSLFYTVSIKEIFKQVLDKFFSGEFDEKTISLLENKNRR